MLEKLKGKVQRLLLSVLSVLLGISMSYTYYLYETQSLGQRGYLLGFGQALLVIIILTLIFYDSSTEN